LPRLTLNCNLPDCCLWSIWNYRCVPPHSVLMTKFLILIRSNFSVISIIFVFMVSYLKFIAELKSLLHFLLCFFWKLYHFVFIFMICFELTPTSDVSSLCMFFFFWHTDVWLF
jgi:hypothetical protein